MVYLKLQRATAVCAERSEQYNSNCILRTLGQDIKQGQHCGQLTVEILHNKLCIASCRKKLNKLSESLSSSILTLIHLNQ